MFFKKKKNELEEYFEQAKNYIENDSVAQYKIKKEGEIVYATLLLDWFFIGNKIMLTGNHVKLIGDNPKSQHALKMKNDLESEIQELHKLLSGKTIEIKRRGGVKSEDIMNEFKRLFI